MIKKKTKRLVSNLLVWTGLFALVGVHVFGAVNDTLGNIVTHSTFMIIVGVAIGIGYWIK